MHRSWKTTPNFDADIKANTKNTAKLNILDYLSEVLSKISINVLRKKNLITAPNLFEIKKLFLSVEILSAEQNCFGTIHIEIS